MSKLLRYHNAIESDWGKIDKQWRETSSLWDDSKRYHFENEFWCDYDPIVRSFLKEIESLSNLIEQAKKNIS